MKLIKIIGIIFVFMLVFEITSVAAPTGYSPKNFIITIKDIQKEEIKNIELLQITPYDELIICEDVNVEYFENYVRLFYSIKKNEHSFMIRIEKTDGSIIRSNNFWTSLSITMGEESSRKEHEKARELLEKTAYFEGNYKTKVILVTEVLEEDSEKIFDEIRNIGKSATYRNIGLSIILVILLVSIIFKSIRKKRIDKRTKVG